MSTAQLGIRDGWMDSRNICLIEDERDIVIALTNFLTAQKYNVVSYNSAEDFYATKTEQFNGLYLIDWNLPGETGVDMIKKVRRNDKISPIFILTAYSHSGDIITGLRAGADDYITKPYNLDELLQRIDNAHNKLVIIKEKIDNEDFKLIPEASAFVKDGKTINLTQREFIIFSKLHELSGEPATREELIESFKNNEKMTVRNIDVHIFSLRKKIKPAELFIETVWGKGYKLI